MSPQWLLELTLPDGYSVSVQLICWLILLLPAFLTKKKVLICLLSKTLICTFINLQFNAYYWHNFFKYLIFCWAFDKWEFSCAKYTRNCLWNYFKANVQIWFLLSKSFATSIWFYFHSVSDELAFQCSCFVH